MLTKTDTPASFEPRAPHLIAAAVCILAALLLLWPLLTGQILFVDGGASLESYQRDFVYMRQA